MIERFHHRGWHWLLLIGISGLMFFANLGGPSLWDIDEGKNANCAVEMMEAGDWIVPTFNGQLRVDKPALLYWLQILSYRCFGINEFAARFPSALAALGTVLLTYELGRSMFRRTTGLLAGVVVGTTPMLGSAARFANPDSLLNFCSLLTLTIFWLGVAQRRWWWFILLGSATGFAVLAKGPVGVIMPTAVVTAFVLWQRQWRIAWDPRWLLNFAAFALTALPWYIWVGIETKGEFLVGFLWKHNIERGTTVLESHTGFPGFYLVVLILGTMPWSIFLVPACWFAAWSAIRCPWTWCQAWWSGASEVGDEEAEDRLTDKPSAYRLLACWIAVYLLFFSVAATKLPNYVLPALVPCTLLIARFLQRWRTGSIQVPSFWMWNAVVMLLVTGIVLIVGFAVAGGADWGLKGEHSIPGLAPWGLLGLAPIAAAVVGWRLARTRQFGGFILAVAVCAILLIGPFAAFGCVVLNRVKAPRPLVEQAEARRRGEDIRIASCDLEHLPSLNFYAQRNVEYLVDETGLENFLQLKVPVYVFLPADVWQAVEPRLGHSARIVARHPDMYRHKEIIVLTNRF
jgi:4-amino-4-deoxy-L-arabinose transferase-like glycosyltransferase